MGRRLRGVSSRQQWPACGFQWRAAGIASVPVLSVLATVYSRRIFVRCFAGRSPQQLSPLRWHSRTLPVRDHVRCFSRGALHNSPTGGIHLDPATVELHRLYHDATVQYVADNYEWVQQKGYSIDVLLSLEDQARIWQTSRERLFRWPRLDEKDMHEVSFRKRGAGPQQFLPHRSDAKARGDPGENVFVINLPRRPSKTKHVLEQLSSAGMHATIVDAIDGDVFTCQDDLRRLGVSTLPGYCGHTNTLPHLTSGQLGCFMSHFTVWHWMVEQGIESALILEDDFDLQQDFSQRLGDALLEAANEDWNLMYLGRSPTEGDWRRVSKSLVEPGYTLWTVAYILRLDAAREFVERHVERQLAPLDHYFSVAMGKGLDLHWNENAREWAKYIPQVLRGLAVTPPLVMPCVSAMIHSDTAMLREGTKYITDLPESE